MPTAALIPALIGGGTALAGSAIAAHAAGSAASQQTASADKAAALQQATTDKILGQQATQYAAGQKLLSPYQSFSANGASRLNTLLGGPTGGTAATTPGLPASGGAPLTLASMMPQGGAGAAGGAVQMQAPDGSIQSVPASQVAHYQSRGARIVGGGGMGQKAQPIAAAY